MREGIRDLRFKLETLLFAWEGVEALQEHSKEPKAKDPEIVSFLDESILRVDEFIWAMHEAQTEIIERNGSEGEKKRRSHV